MRHPLFWLRYRMRPVVAHKFGRHEWRWTHPIPDEISPIDHGWWHCDWCGATMENEVDAAAVRVVKALHDTRWCRCPDGRTMLCQESAQVVKVALAGETVNAWVGAEGPELIP